MIAQAYITFRYLGLCFKYCEHILKLAIITIVPKQYCWAFILSQSLLLLRKRSWSNFRVSVLFVCIFHTFCAFACVLLLIFCSSYIVLIIASYISVFASIILLPIKYYLGLMYCHLILLLPHSSRAYFWVPVVFVCICIPVVHSRVYCDSFFCILYSV